MPHKRMKKATGHARNADESRDKPALSQTNQRASGQLSASSKQMSNRSIDDSMQQIFASIRKIKKMQSLRGGSEPQKL